MITSIEPWEEVEEVENEIPDREQERLDHELYRLIDQGAFRPSEFDQDEDIPIDLDAALTT